MATHTDSATDKGIGLAMAFGALVVVGAVAMVVGALNLARVPETTAAWGFAGAILAATIAVVAVHVWE